MRGCERGQCVGLGEEHVACLEVRVHDLLRMQVQHRARDVVREGEHEVHGGQVVGGARVDETLLVQCST